MGILKQQEEEDRRKQEEQRRHKNQSKGHNQGHTHNQPKPKGGSQPKFQLPLVKSFVTSYKFLLLVAEDAIVAAALAFVMWGALRVAGVQEVVIPTEFGVVWSVVLGIFLVQTIIWKR